MEKPIPLEEFESEYNRLGDSIISLTGLNRSKPGATRIDYPNGASFSVDFVPSYNIPNSVSKLFVFASADLLPDRLFYLGLDAGIELGDFKRAPKKVISAGIFSPDENSYVKHTNTRIALNEWAQVVNDLIIARRNSQK